MKTLALLSPLVGVGQSSLILDLGWVLADAGFGVALLDLDPQAGLTTLAGLEPDAPGSVFDTLGSVLGGGGELGTVDPTRLAPNLLLLRGDLQLGVLDDRLAVAKPYLEPGESEPRVLDPLVGHLADEHEIDVVLCDLGPNLGPLNRAIVESIDGVVVPITPGRAQGALRSLGEVLLRWQARSTEVPEAIEQLGFVLVGPPASIRERARSLIASLDRLRHLGTIEHYPGLASMARMACKPQVELSPADGVMGAHADAVRDHRVQVENLATALVHAAGMIDSPEFADALVETLEQELTAALGDEIPTELDGLSSRTTIDLVEDVQIHEVTVRRGGLRVSGSASVSVDLEWGGGERRDGVEGSDSFPLRFTVELDRERELAAVHHIEVDVSSFYE